jgi:hypothetical protein
MARFGDLKNRARRAFSRRRAAMLVTDEIIRDVRRLMRSRFRLIWSDEVVAMHDVIIRRSGAGYDILVSPWFDHWAALDLVRDKIGTCLFWMHESAPEVREASFSATDGDRFSLARFSFSSNEDAVIPIPDSHFFRARGYRATDRAAQELGRPWDSRSGEIVWRGQPTGNGYFTSRVPMLGHPGQVQRLRLASVAAGLGVDFGFVVPATQPEYPEMAARGLLRPRIEADSWAGRKFALDVDGFTNAWSNLLCRMKLGCCVLKVASDYGFRQWYYPKMQPFEHFVPVASDFSDLAERLEWVRTHDREARAIAAEGQNLARAMTFESETMVAADLIGDHWNS